MACSGCLKRREALTNAVRRTVRRVRQIMAKPTLQEGPGTMKRIMLSKKECDEAGSDEAILALAEKRGIDLTKPYRRWQVGPGVFTVFQQNN
jgi:hypothetical protein